MWTKGIRNDKMFFIKREACFCDARTKPYTLIYMTHLLSQSIQICLCPNEWFSNPDTPVKHTLHDVAKQQNTTRETQIIMDIGVIWRTFIQQRTVTKRRKQIAFSIVRNVQILYSAPCWFEQHDAVKGSVCSVRHLMKWLATYWYNPNRTVGILFSLLPWPLSPVVRVTGVRCWPITFTFL
jgi:hypothetical protein